MLLGTLEASLLTEEDYLGLEKECTELVIKDKELQKKIINTFLSFNKV